MNTSVAEATGYLHLEYAASLQEFGAPCELPRSGGWLLKRQIPRSPYRDGMGCYPLFTCRDWSQLGVDIEALSRDMVSVSMVLDPFGSFDTAAMRRCFRDVFVPFKQHYVIDLELPLDQIGGRRRRKHARRALKDIEIRVVEQPLAFLDEWTRIYDVLIRKHGITGIRAFSRSSFARQLSLPGTVLLQAVHEGATIGAQIYFVQDDVIHVHLGACTDKGYELEATYALDWYSVEYFKSRGRWLNLGGGAGLSNGTDGLSQYKSGWATGTRTTYFCGRILDESKYRELRAASQNPGTSYFPAYRHGEFT